VPVAGFGPAVYPPAEIERFDWTPVELEVHRGTVDIVVPIEIVADAGTGDLTVTGHVRYQACTEAACFPPVEERIEGRVRIQARPKAEPVDEASPAAQMARSWDRVASAYDTAVPFFSVLGRRVADRLHLQPGERVLDVATGRGACLLPAAERLGPTGWVVGTDVSSEMIAQSVPDSTRQ
jgi:hypothetical protein